MIFYRFGEIPKNEKSCIWKGNEKVGEEPGVSVYEAHKNINGTYSLVLPFPTNEMAFNDFIYNVKYFTGNKYLVTGDLLDETGTDGEPLIKNVKILKKIIAYENRKYQVQGKNLNSGKWIEGDLIRKSNGIYIRRHKYLSAIVDASTVCIFTGLTDKNGTPIYEGDIVIYRDNNAERRGSINWDSKATAFYFGQDFLVYYPSENMVVVGNEFDI